MTTHTRSGEGSVLRPNPFQRLFVQPLLSGLYRLVWWICRNLGDRAAFSFSRVAVRVMVQPFRHIRIGAMQRFMMSSGKTGQDCAGIDDAYLKYQGRVLAENVRLLTISSNQLQENLRLEGELLLRQALQDGRGVVVVCTHVGNWLLAPALLSTLGYRIFAIAYEIPVRSIEEHMQQFAKRYSITVARPGRDSVREARKALGRNEVVMITFDASVRPMKNEWMPFGDIAISVDPGPARIASLLNAPILRMRTCPQPLSGATLILEPDPADPNDPMPTWLNHLHDEVSKHPELWWPWSFVSLADRSAVEQESVHSHHTTPVIA